MASAATNHRQRYLPPRPASSQPRTSLPRTTCHKPAAGGWRTASAARSLFGGTTPLTPPRAPLCRRERRAERVGRRPPTALRFQLKHASNRAASNHPTSNYPATNQQPVDGGQRAQLGAYSEARRAHPRILNLLPTRAQRGASRPLPGGCPPRTTDSLEPLPPRTAPISRPISSRRTAGSERSAEPIRRHNDPHPRLLNLSCRRERSAERVDRCPAAARPEPPTALNPSFLEPLPPRTTARLSPPSPHKKRVMPPHFSCGHMTRIFTPFQAHIPHLILPISMLISSAFTLCVSAPTEMTSTPAAAAAASVVSSMPPDASTTAR